MAGPRQRLDDLQAFVAVARERSFTTAAARLGVTQSALSHTVRQLEARLGLRLLARTTRSVAPTDAGQRLLEAVAPRLEEIAEELAALVELRERPGGKLRITVDEYAADSLLWPRLGPFLATHPQIELELVIDYGLTDIVAQRYDLGVRLGDQVAKDMIAVRIGPDMRMAVVGAPAYFEAHGQPRTPRQLTGHNGINLRLPTHGGLYAWEFEKRGRTLKVRMDGQTIVNGSGQLLQAALQGVGLAYLPEGMVRPWIEAGRLREVLADWCAPFAGYHLYYPNRLRGSPALTALIEVLRHRPD